MKSSLPERYPRGVAYADWNTKAKHVRGILEREIILAKKQPIGRAFVWVTGDLLLSMYELLDEKIVEEKEDDIFIN